MDSDTLDRYLKQTRQVLNIARYELSTDRDVISFMEITAYEKAIKTVEEADLGLQVFIEETDKMLAIKNG